MTMAIDTLRLEEPSTLFDTQALENIRRQGLFESSGIHIVLATGEIISQVTPIRLYCCILTDNRENPTRSNRGTIN